MNKAFSYDPNERMTLLEMAGHKFFEGYISSFAEINAELQGRYDTVV